MDAFYTFALSFNATHMQFIAVIWNPDPQILPLGPVSLRWYGLLFASGFVFGYLIFQHFIRKEKLKMELLDRLIVYMAVGTVVGARLGHCLFYDPSYYLSHPLEILKVWEGGLASHGAGIAILITIWIFGRKEKVSFLWVMDRVVITVALAGMLIRTGNLMNSEIYGVATNSNSGFVFMRHLSQELRMYKPVEEVSFAVPEGAQLVDGKYLPIDMQLVMNKQVKEEKALLGFMEYTLIPQLRVKETEETNYLLLPDKQAEYSVVRNAGGNLVLKARIYGIPKYPTQVIEALAYLSIFILLIGLYLKKGTAVYRGVYFGLFLVLVFGARFFIEFYKEVQVSFESGMPLNMGQILSIPFVLGGLLLLYAAWRLKKPSVHSL
ncbi:MAG: prolipoprotein diacylglyceryl transferase [Bacteroidales bacterium]